MDSQLSANPRGVYFDGQGRATPRPSVWTLFPPPLQIRAKSLRKSRADGFVFANICHTKSNSYNRNQFTLNLIHLSEAFQEALLIKEEECKGGELWCPGKDVFLIFPSGLYNGGIHERTGLGARTFQHNFLLGQLGKESARKGPHNPGTFDTFINYYCLIHHLPIIIIYFKNNSKQEPKRIAVTSKLYHLQYNLILLKNYSFR